MPCRSAHLELAVFFALLPACVLRCGDNTFPAVDAGMVDAGSVFDGGETGDGAPPLTRVDFAVGGCERQDETGCRGQGPLTLSFAAITSAPVQVYLWQFGDGATSTEAAPIHTYSSPGLYTVSLDVEGPGGGLGESKAGWIDVSPAGLGRPCGADDDCVSGLCVCGADDGDCAVPLAGRGMCAATCDGASPCAEGLCIDLDPASAAAPQDWQTTLCLPDCTSPCESGLQCQALLGADGSYTEACFANGVLAPIGAGCVDADGVFVDARCSSGQCNAVGARGLCGSACESLACPAQTACATFAGPLGSQCVRECDEEEPCLADPWLACEQPGNPGSGGFSVEPPALPAGYCAPAYCGDDPDQCGADGVCVASYCEAL